MKILSVRRVIRLVLCVLFLIFALSMLASCQGGALGGDAPEGMKRVTVEDEYLPGGADYTLFIPEDWTADMDCATICASCEDGTSVSVLASDITGYATYLSEWESKSKTFEMVFDDFEVISSEESEIGGEVAGVYTYTATVAGVKCRFSQTFFIHKTSLYILTFTSDNDKFSAHADEFAKISEAFTFDKNKEAPEGMKAAVVIGDEVKTLSGYTMYIDEDWGIDHVGNAVSCRLTNGYRSNISVMTAPAGIYSTAEDYWDAHNNELAGSLTDYRILTDDCTATILDGLAAHKYVFTCKSEYAEGDTVKSIDYKFCQVICINEGTVFIITYTGDFSEEEGATDYYENYLSVFNEVLDNFEIN